MNREEQEFEDFWKEASIKAFEINSKFQSLSPQNQQRVLRTLYDALFIQGFGQLMHS